MPRKTKKPECLYCNTEVSRRPKKFCNNTCQQRYQTIASYEKDPNAVGPRSLRTYLLITRTYKCEVCKNSKWNGAEIPLEVDHIDGNPENNVEANVRLICPNCHAQTPTYKSKNKGNGRWIRRERYAQKKSC